MPTRKFTKNDYGIKEFDDNPEGVNGVIDDKTITNSTLLYAYLETTRKKFGERVEKLLNISIDGDKAPYFYPVIKGWGRSREKAISFCQKNKDRP